MIADKNADRFKGFAEIYNNVRPACPEYVLNILPRYLEHLPQTEVDIGCGTGLSTIVWKDTAQKIIGVEPSDDMLKTAEENSRNISNIEYIKAFSNNTGLPDGIAYIITCSQSFHWMEPVSTLKEINRLLKPGGVFAAYDCDWPPVCSFKVELAYEKLFAKVNKIESENDKYRTLFVMYPKDQHLQNIKNSGNFRYTREIVFSNTEKCSAERYFGIAISQGGVQSILKQEPELIEEDLNKFKKTVEEDFCGEVKEIEFCYRMRLGVK